MKTDHYVTPEALERLKATIIRLRTIERPQTLEDVVRTREMGDLSENAGYQIAKAKLRLIDNRLLSIEEKIKSAIMIDTVSDATGKIRIGSTVVLKKDGKEITYQILGSQESDPLRGKISYLSPLGHALLGHEAGETINDFLVVEVK